jgi:ribose 5-phosphate isomerase A
VDDEELKRAAAERALEEVRDGMLLGLGTGSTSRYFIAGVASLVHGGMRLSAVATSKASAAQARELGIVLVEEAQSPLDLTVDGADEIDPGLNLIKGLGGALLREKVVASASRRMVVIATEEKLVPRLGTRGPLPVEVLPLLWERTAERLERLGLRPRLRPQRPGAASPHLTDNGNLILDCGLDPVADLMLLAARLEAIPGVLGHGLFLGLASVAMVGTTSGVRLIEASAPA